MGVPPDPNAIRRNARVGPVILPAQGREGEPPAWPHGEMSGEEASLWAELWALPAATQWERLKHTRTVARYVRLLVLLEQDFRAKDVLAQLLAIEDRLGLTPKAMRALLWTVAVDEVAVKRAEARPSTSARGRLKAVG